jgi:hypothetical protein
VYVKKEPVERLVTPVAVPGAKPVVEISEEVDLGPVLVPPH